MSTPEGELIFPPGYDERGEWEAEQRGLLDNVKVRVPDGKIYDVCFFTTQRLAVEVALTEKGGQPWLAYPGLILVPVVNRIAMQAAIDGLIDTDHFSQLTPV